MPLTRATPDEIEWIEVLDRARFPGADTPGRGTVYWILDHDAGRGYCAARLTPEGAYMERSYVGPALRGKRLQRHMIRVRCRWARAQGAKRVTTYTWSGNVGSMRNLIACGFTIADRSWDGQRVWIHWARDLV